MTIHLLPRPSDGYRPSDRDSTAEWLLRQSHGGHLCGCSDLATAARACEMALRWNIKPVFICENGSTPTRYGAADLLRLIKSGGDPRPVREG